MADKAREWTDKELEKMERHIAEIYQEAQDGIKEKWDGYMERAEKRVERYQNAVEKAVEGGNKDEIKAAKNALKRAEKNITIADQYYREMVDETTTRLANTNQIAIDYMNGNLPKIYSRNYNDEDPAAKKLGISYSIRNEATVKRMILDGDIQLPYKKLDIDKDKRWNTKLLNSQVLQGILQGESMPQISKRILPVVDNNKNAAVRNARTMVTGAENRGKSDRFHALQDRGAVIKKVWIATPDGRTRDWHLSMDGQEVELDEDFIDGNGNELSYPGDPDGEPETVYNCRCSMVSNIVGFRKANGDVVMIEDYDEGEELHDEQIEREKGRRWQNSKQPGVSGSTTAEPDKDGAMREVPKTQSAESIEESCKNVNPHFGHDDKYSTNCASCSVAFELRQRGYDVQARPRNYSENVANFWNDNKRGRGSFTDSFSTMDAYYIGTTRKANAKADLESEMQKYGNGSRAIVFIEWDGRKVGHYFNIVNDGGNIEYIDSQISKSGEYVSDYLKDAKPSRTRIFRTDDKELDEYVRKVVTWDDK